MARILLVEDETSNQKIVRACLFQHHVTVASSLNEARQQLKEERWDLIILDIHLPDGNGLTFMVELQGQNQQIPVVLFTQKSEDTDIVAGYTMGADDYITKPINPVVFKAQVEAILRRIGGQKTEQGSYKQDQFIFSLEKQTVVYEADEGQRSLDLTSLEFKLFIYFAKHKDHVLSRDKLICDVWGNNLNITDRTVDSHVSHLRKKLVGSTLTLLPVYGAGYKLTSTKAAA